MSVEDLTIEFCNLSNGIACAPSGAQMMRLQSTWCEQKRWDDILWTTPAGLYFALSQGASAIVHDQSERERLTRAQWQGLSWIRYACRAAWGMPEEPEFSRSGSAVTHYWRQVWATTSERTRKHVRYFKPLVESPVLLAPCACARVQAHTVVTPSRPAFVA